MTSFKYNTLDADSQYIRLMTIESIDHEHCVSIHLETCLLADVIGTYNAISYTWGPETPTFPINIRIDDETKASLLYARSNITKYLRHLAQTDVDTCQKLWVDSICIDQANDVEKSTQVRMMYQIYSHASCVLIWLDIVSKESILTEDGLQEMWNCLTNEDAHWHPAYNPIYLPTVMSCSPAKKLLFGEQHLKSLVELQRVLNHPYWTRLWIVQELALAKDVRLIVSSHKLSLESLKLDALVSGTWPGIKAHDSDRVDADTIIRKLRTCSQIARIGHICKKGDSVMAIRHVLPLVVDRQCFEKKDKVYALTGMTNHAGKYPIDYSIAIEQVFLDALRVMANEQDEVIVQNFFAEEHLTLFHAETLTTAQELTSTACLAFISRLNEAGRQPWLKSDFELCLKWTSRIHNFCEVCYNDTFKDVVVQHEHCKCTETGSHDTNKPPKPKRGLYGCYLGQGLGMIVAPDLQGVPCLEYLCVGESGSNKTWKSDVWLRSPAVRQPVFDELGECWQKVCPEWACLDEFLAKSGKVMMDGRKFCVMGMPRRH